LVRHNKVFSIDKKENSVHEPAATANALPPPDPEEKNQQKVQPAPTASPAPVTITPLSRKAQAVDEAIPVTETKWQYFRKKWVLDTKDEFYYYWLGTLSCAFAYNLIVVIARSVFHELASGYYWIAWVVVDFIMDSIYVFDMFVRSRTGFLEQGLLVRDIPRIRKLYFKSMQFKLDILSVLPFDLILSIALLRPMPYLRFNRIIRYPPSVECFSGVEDTLARRYIYSFYWSTLILTTIGEVPGPQRNIEFVFVILDLMCGVLIFATIVGNLETRVIKWFDYLWANKQSLSDQRVLKVLPDKLQTEIAMQVHFETLRKVRIFQVFSPGDYICRKGDIGREMYIVKQGKLQVVADDGSKNGNRRTANVRSVGYTDLFVLNKNDLWTALKEYPDARKLLIAKLSQS
uniref:Cyclic nucleotide-binding domain-containing protein n=1 Tax=Gongylonema pulchrum TaxID=637853 RepID=A0A183E2K0_9BILA